MVWPFLIFIWVPSSCDVSSFVCGREGAGRGSCSSLGNPGRRGSFVGKTFVDCCCLCPDFFFPFSLVALCGARSWWHFDLTPFRLGTQVWGPFFPPLMWKNRFLDYSTLMLWERRLQMTSKTLFLFFHTKTIGIASSWLSQSTGVYHSGHLLQIWGQWSKCTWGIEWWCWRSLFPNM